NSLLPVSLPLRNRNWRRVAPRAWQQLPLLQPAKIAGCVVITLLNILWTGHGVFRSWPVAARFAGVLVLSYLFVTTAEFLWRLLSVPQAVDLGFREENPAAPATPEVDPLVEQLRTVPAPVLKEGTLKLAEARGTFGGGREGPHGHATHKH